MVRLAPLLQELCGLRQRAQCQGHEFCLLLTMFSLGPDDWFYVCCVPVFLTTAFAAAGASCRLIDGTYTDTFGIRSQNTFARPSRCSNQPPDEATAEAGIFAVR
jgi:hypothetical protein